MFDYKYKIWKITLIICLVVLVFLSVFILKPVIDQASDSPSYLEAIQVLNGAEQPTSFIPNRIITTFLGLKTVSLFSNLLPDLPSGWFIINLALYFLLSVTFYNLIIKLFGSEKAALLGTLFLASNYALINFGLGFYMDIGGWAFYIFSIYFLFLYSESKNYKILLLSALMVSIGGLWKEYAFLGVIPIFCFLIYENWPNLLKAIKRGLWPALIVIIPTFILHFFVYKTFNYTYLDWLSQNQVLYSYHSRIIEYFKSFGSLFNFLSISFALGAYIFLKRGKEMMQEKKNRVFIISILLSVLPIFFWPAITQRILFITIPGAILISSLAFKKYEKYWCLFLILLIAYVLANFTMDSFILSYVNLPF